MSRALVSARALKADGFTKLTPVSCAVYDAELNVLLVDVKEKLNVWFIPLPSKAGR